MQFISFTFDPGERAEIYNHYFTEGRPNDRYFSDRASGQLDPAFQEAIRLHLEAHPEEFELFLDINRPLSSPEEQALARIEARFKELNRDSILSRVRSLLESAALALSQPLQSPPSAAVQVFRTGDMGLEGALFVKGWLSLVEPPLGLDGDLDAPLRIQTLQSLVSGMIERAARAGGQNAVDSSEDVLLGWGKFCAEMEAVCAGYPPTAEARQSVSEALLQLSEVVSTWDSLFDSGSEVDDASAALRLCAEALEDA